MTASPGRWRAPLARGARTATAVALVAAGARLPLPFVHAVELGGGSWQAKPLSLFPLGVAPFVGAFLFVELAALVLPSLKALRRGTASQRSPLARASWLLAAAMSAWQGWALGRYLQATSGVHGLPILEPGLAPAAAVAVTVVAGVLVQGWLATVVTRHGLGNGFAVLLAADAAERLWRSGLAAARVPRQEWSDAALLAGLALVVVGGLVAAQQHRHRQRIPALPVPTSGLAVATGAGALLLFASRLADWVPALAPLADWLATEGWWGTAADLAVTAVLATLFSRAFCPPRPVALVFRNAGVEPLQEAGMRLALRAAHRRSLALVMAVAAVPALSALLDLPLALDAGLAFDLVLVGAVALDLLEEARGAGGRGAVITACEVHRLYEVYPLVQALARAGIAAEVRTRRFRTLFHFFAPYAPVEIRVAPERAAEAEVLCAAVAGVRPAPGPSALGAPEEAHRPHRGP